MMMTKLKNHKLVEKHLYSKAVELVEMHFPKGISKERGAGTVLMSLLLIEFIKFLDERENEKKTK